MGNPFTRTNKPIPKAPEPDQPTPRKFPALGAEWGDDTRVDGIRYEEINAAEAHKRRGELTDAQLEGFKIEAQLAAREIQDR